MAKITKNEFNKIIKSNKTEYKIVIPVNIEDGEVNICIKIGNNLDERVSVINYVVNTVMNLDITQRRIAFDPIFYAAIFNNFSNIPIPLKNSGEEKILDNNAINDFILAINLDEKLKCLCISEDNGTSYVAKQILAMRTECLNIIDHLTSSEHLSDISNYLYTISSLFRKAETMINDSVEAMDAINYLANATKEYEEEKAKVIDITNGNGSNSDV